MKLLKNNIKLIIGIIIGAILAGEITYAAISASEVEYTKEGTEINNVGDALNDLYDKVMAQQNEVIYLGSYYGSSNVSNQSTATLTINNLNIGENYSMIVGRSNTGGSNAYFFDTGSGNVTVDNASYTKSGYKINFTPTATSITINFPLNNQTTSNGGKIYCWVFKGSF